MVKPDDWDKVRRRAGRRAARKAVADDRRIAAEMGTKKCTSPICQFAGQDLPLECFQKCAREADGHDYYCKQCRGYRAALAIEINTERAERWARQRNYNKRARRAAPRIDSTMKPKTCKRHPWMLVQDCDLDGCTPPKCDRRYGPHSAAVKKKIANTMKRKRYVNNPEGRNWGAKGNPLTGKGERRKPLTYDHISAIKSGMSHFWGKKRNF